MLWNSEGTIYPARVDLHDLVPACSPEQGPGPDLSFFEEYVNFLQGLIDLFFTHLFTHLFTFSRIVPTIPVDQGKRGPCPFIASVHKVPGDQ